MQVFLHLVFFLDESKVLGIFCPAVVFFLQCLTSFHGML